MMFEILQARWKPWKPGGLVFRANKQGSTTDMVKNQVGILCVKDLELPGTRAALGRSPSLFLWSVS